MSPVTPEPTTLAVLLASRVRVLRGRLGISRASLASVSGISPAYLARLEAGDANVSLALLERLARALRQTPHGLIAPAGEHSADIVGTRLPARIALIGLRGAGKSTLGSRLATRLDRPFIELNQAIAQAGGLSVPEIFNMYGDQGFRQLERRCLAQALDEHPAMVLATGGGIVNDSRSYELLRRHFTTVWLKAAPSIHFDRVRRQQDRRIASPELRQAALQNITRLLAERERRYALASLQLDTSGRSPAGSLVDLLDLLRAPMPSGGDASSV